MKKAFGKLRTLNLILTNLPTDGAVLCGFLETLRPEKNSHLPSLEVVARKRQVAVVATLSLAAARHYKAKIPSYALFTNTSGVLDPIAVYEGDMRDADAINAFVLENKPPLTCGVPGGRSCAFSNAASDEPSPHGGEL